MGEWVKIEAGVDTAAVNVMVPREFMSDIQWTLRRTQ